MIKAAVLFTQFYKDNTENKHFSAVVKRLIKNFSGLQIEFVQEFYCAHEYTDTAAGISEAAGKYPLVFVIPALPSSYVGDTVPAALSASADCIVCSNIPQDTLSDLMIATKKNSKIVVLPYHYDKVSSPIADKFIKMAKDKNTPFRLMGFGHRVYKSYDPRAVIIRKECENYLSRIGLNDPLLNVARKLEETALKDEYFIERNLYPNVDFYTGILYRAMGIPENMFTVMFALARLPGWVAHWREMIGDSTKIVRPRQLYIGRTVQEISEELENRSSRFLL